MDRKKFLSSLIATAASAAIPAASAPRNTTGTGLLIPSYLRPGDTIGITSPAGAITLADIQPALERLRAWGFRYKIGAAIGLKNYNFGGTDEQRARDLQAMLDDPGIKAILCARGGYGVVRIIDRLDFSGFQRHPKWIIGFSDITILHLHLSTRIGVASIHSKMCNSFPASWNDADMLLQDTILSIRNAISGSSMKYSCMPSAFNRKGNAEGVLVGGNLKTIESMSGTPSDLQTDGKILFVEDTGEYLYSIDRMFWNLMRTGKLSRLRGLIIGGFKIKPDDPGEEFGMTLQDIVLEKVKRYSYPVMFDFPVGHQKNNFALKCGVIYRMNVTADSCTLEEIPST